MHENMVVIESSDFGQDLEDLVPAAALDFAQREKQRAIPAIAKNPMILQEIERAVKQVPTRHRLFLGDSRSMEEVPDESVHLAVTSPPYWTLKEYPVNEGQLGSVEDYEEFLEELN